MRKLATIRRIDAIKPIENADSIECAVIGGWQVVIKKGEFLPGDHVIYCEVDSWIPHALAPFLTKNGSSPREYNGVPGERLRTVKLRGQISQGLVLPLSCIPFVEVDINACLPDGYYDITEALGIQKWEPPIPACLAGIVKGPWPSVIPKTDQERIQNLTETWGQLREHEYEVTEKLEGSSMTVGLLNNDFIVCSRNLNLKETAENTFWQQARHHEIEEKLRVAGIDNLVLQGELVGEGVQGNYYEIKGHNFYIFDVYDIGAGRYLNPTDRQTLCKSLNLCHVPVKFDALGLNDARVDEVLTMADGKSEINPSKAREGLVFKSADGLTHWKAVSNAYLAKIKD